MTGGGTEGIRRGHGQYPEDATPKCSFLTTCPPCFFSQMRKPPPKLPSGQTWRRGWLKTDTGGTPIRYRSNTGVTRLQVACRALWARKSKDSGDCGLSGERGREKAEESRQNEEIRGKRAELTRPSRERRCSEYVAGGDQGGWSARHSWGLACQPLTSWLARRNSTGPTGGWSNLPD